MPPGAGGSTADGDAPARRGVRSEARIAGRTGLVLAVGAALATGAWCAMTGVPGVGAAAALVLVAVAGALLAVIDARTHRLPDVLVLRSWVAVLVLLALGALVHGTPTTLGRAALGGAVAFCAYAALRLAYPPGLGFGDVKLAGPLGTALAGLGWAELAVGLLLPFLLGGVWSLVLLASRRADRRTAVPFGPFMVLGGALGAVVGPTVVSAYALT